MRHVLFALVLFAAAPAAGQPCTGDCNGNGTVGIEELVTGVRIALGDAPVASCVAFDANDDGAVGIEELVRAVNAALGGCPAAPTATGTAAATPTPSPESTATAEATDTPEHSATPDATATATPTLPPIDGPWSEVALTVTESTCDESTTCDGEPATFTCFFQQLLAERGPCVQQVERTGEATVRVTDCSEQAVDGTLSPEGAIALTFPPATESVGGCTLNLATTSTVSVVPLPVIATYTFEIGFSGEACPLPDCTVRATGAWTRLED